MEETVKMDPDRVKRAIEAAGGKWQLGVRLNRTIRQINNYLASGNAPRYISDRIEDIIREYERQQSRVAAVKP